MTITKGYIKMSEAELVTKALKEHFTSIAKVCHDAGNMQRMIAYEVAARACDDVLNAGYGWCLELQEKIKKLREANEDAKQL